MLTFYTPLRFHIKSHPTCQDEDKNFFILSLYQKLDKSDQTVMASVLKNNSYFCHPENILLAAVGNEDENIRKFAHEKLLLAGNALSSDRIRCFDKNIIKINLTSVVH
jgi:hypothetical protein